MMKILYYPPISNQIKDKSDKMQRYRDQILMSIILQSDAATDKLQRCNLQKTALFGLNSVCE